VLRTVQAADIAGIRAILVHAISSDAQRFYERHGFVSSPIDPMMLMIALAEMAESYPPSSEIKGVGGWPWIAVSLAEARTRAARSVEKHPQPRFPQPIVTSDLAPLIHSFHHCPAQAVQFTRIKLKLGPQLLCLTDFSL
jgi:hypothetical protein